MTNDLSVYERIQDPMAAVRELGNAIAKSQLFGCANVEQGQVFAMECLARRCPPLSLAEEYHIIQGRLSMRADAMLARFIDAGGKHRVIDRTPELAAVSLEIGGHKQTFSYSWKYAEAAGAHLTGNGKPLPMWSTPRGRMQMLWARVISDGVRTMAPQVCRGKYTPEDLGQADDREQVQSQVNHEQQEQEAAGVPAAGPSSPGPSESPAAALPPHTGKPDASGPVSSAEAAGVAPSGTSTKEQRDKLASLCDELDSGNHDGKYWAMLDAALKKRGFASTRSLNFDDAAGMIAKLQAALVGKRVADGVAGVENAPACEALVVRARKALEEYAQTDPAGVKQVVANLKGAGLKLSDLSTAEAEALIQAIGVKNIAAFIGRSLVGGKARPQ